MPNLRIHINSRKKFTPPTVDYQAQVGGDITDRFTESVAVPPGDHCQSSFQKTVAADCSGNKVAAALLYIAQQVGGPPYRDPWHSILLDKI